MANPRRPLHCKDFEIAIRCALPVEFGAAKASFGEFWGNNDTYGKAPGDPNAYATGRIGNHNVILTYMPGYGQRDFRECSGQFSLQL
jgi:hypothetical protein